MWDGSRENALPLPIKAQGMAKFYPLPLKEVYRETEDCTVLEFDVPAALRQTFRFQAGQYLTLRKYIDEQELRRPYSLCSAPHEERWCVAVKRIPNGRFSNYVHRHFKAGDVVDVMPPMGHFTPKTDYRKGGLYVAMAAGSGITPVMSILKTILHESDSARFQLFYGNRTQREVIFFEELQRLKNRYPERLALHFIYSRERPEEEIYHGRITPEKIRHFAARFFDPTEVDEFFLCGPGDMIQRASETLRGLDVPEERIRFELFTPADDSTTAETSSETTTEPQISSDVIRVKVVLDGDEYTIEAHPKLPLLDSVLDAGLDAPWACRSGICCTCKAKLLSGEVVMEEDIGLDEDERRQGYILTCQAYPKSEHIHIDYDV